VTLELQTKVDENHLRRMDQHHADGAEKELEASQGKSGPRRQYTRTTGA
jgi:hypothetical protein